MVEEARPEMMEYVMTALSAWSRSTAVNCATDVPGDDVE